MRPTRREIAWLAASWLAWAFVAVHVRGPWDTIAAGGDHWSHVGCAELFLHHGFDLWRHPPGDFCTTALPPAEATFPREAGCRPFDVCQMRDLPDSRPLCINWQTVGPQPYPPGLILFSLPQALLYEHTSIAFRTIDVLTILEYLLAAHLLFWILWRMVFPPRTRDDLLGGTSWELTNPWLRFLLFGLVYLEIVQQTLNGFYDPLAIFAVFLGAYFVAKHRPVDGLLALSLGFVLHYRALWYAPLLAYAGLRSLPPATWSTKAMIKLGVSALLLGLFAYTLLLINPWLPHWPDTNPVLWQHASPWKQQQWDLLLPMTGLVLYLAWGRHWLLLASMVWQLAIILRTPQIMTWHALFLLPMLGVARLDGERGAMLAAWIFYLVEAVVIFKAVPLPGELVSALAANWGPASF